MTTLQTLIKEVHLKGFNISAMINLFKKRQREAGSTREVPEEVYVEVCLEYLKDRNIKKDFPYFLKVLNLKADHYHAKQLQEEAEKNKFNEFMPEHLKSIMRRA